MTYPRFFYKSFYSIIDVINENVAYVSLETSTTRQEQVLQKNFSFNNIKRNKVMTSNEFLRNTCLQLLGSIL